MVPCSNVVDGIFCARRQLPSNLVVAVQPSCTRSTGKRESQLAQACGDDFNPRYPEPRIAHSSDLHGLPCDELEGLRCDNGHDSRVARTSNSTIHVDVEAQ